MLNTFSEIIVVILSQVNFLVVLFGLFHGLFLIPVLLSWIGPDPYPNASSHGHGGGGHGKPENGDAPKTNGQSNEGFSIQVRHYTCL